MKKALSTLILPLLICILATPCSFAADPPRPSWNIQRTLIYEFRNKQGRDQALSRLKALFGAKGFKYFTYPEGSAFGYGKSVAGTELTINYDLPRGTRYQLRFSIHAYIGDGVPSRFAAVTEEARKFFAAYDKTFGANSTSGPYRIPGP